jgi:hypothetical protein
MPRIYGPTIQELIREQSGDGIMSAINFRLDIRREPGPGGDRVIVTPYGSSCPTSGEDGPARGARNMTIRAIEPCPRQKREF